MKVNLLHKLDMEVSHVFTYDEYTKKQRFYIWRIYMLRNFADILSGIIGLITFGYIQTRWSSSFSEKILRKQMEFYKERKNNG